jgi:hypothetical protein
LSTLIENYLPIQVVAEKEKALFDVLLQLLQKEGMNKDAIVDQMFNFLSDEEHLEIAIDWLSSTEITIGDEPIY